MSRRGFLLKLKSRMNY